MRRYAALILVVFTAGCGSLQLEATTIQQRLFAANAEYIVYGEIVKEAVRDPLTHPETKAALKDLNRRTYSALQVAKSAFLRGELTDVAVVLAETGLRELRSELVRQGKVQ